MPVYNGEAFISEAIDSILAQTFTDFNFYIVNDGSTDNTLEIIRQYNDEKIKILSLDNNYGISTALNEGIRIINEPYIARMDADDIAVPERLSLQVAFMDKNPKYVVCGGNLKIIGKEEIWRYPRLHEDIVCTMLFNNATAHNTAMIRTKELNAMKSLYRPNFKGMEDYDLWYRLAYEGNFANLEKILVHYRRSPKSVTISERANFRTVAMAFFGEKFKSFGISFNEHELETHVDIHLKNEESIIFGQKHTYWLNKLEKEINALGIFPAKALKSVIDRKKKEVLKFTKL